MRGVVRGLLVVPLLLSALAGCLNGDDAPSSTTSGDDLLPDLPVAPVPDPWYDISGFSYLDYHAPTLTGGVVQSPVTPFHTLDEIAAKIDAWNTTYPGLVDVRVIGETLQGRPIWDVVLTDESVPGPKATPLLDGGHHANELGGIEIMLYTIDYLLINHATNATVRGLLRDLAIHIVPLLNPDGYVVQTRGNALGVNLNRNYDIDWGNPLGASNLLMGTVAHTLGRPVPTVPIVAENCGPSAFSEPETRAMRDLMHNLSETAVFYVTGHTPTHAVIAPWGAYDPPFPVPDDHREVLDAELNWIRTHTEYEAGRAAWGDLSAGLPYAASGSSMDYFYVTTGQAGFTVEVEFYITSATSEDYPMRWLGEFEGLRYWMDATLPIIMHLLANWDHIQAWETPTRAALIPEGSVPTPPERPFPAPPPVMH